MSPRDQLNEREIQVATMVWEGKTNPEIALVLGSTEQVVKNLLRGIFDKAGSLEPPGTGTVRGLTWRCRLGAETSGNSSRKDSVKGKATDLHGFTDFRWI